MVRCQFLTMVSSMFNCFISNIAVVVGSSTNGHMITSYQSPDTTVVDHHGLAVGLQDHVHGLQDGLHGTRKQHGSIETKGVIIMVTNADSWATTPHQKHISASI